MAMFTSGKLTEKIMLTTRMAIALLEDGCNIDDYDELVDGRVDSKSAEIIHRQEIFFITPIKNNWERRKYHTLAIISHTLELLEYAMFTSDLSWKEYLQFQKEISQPDFTRDEIIQLCATWLLKADYYDDK